MDAIVADEPRQISGTLKKWCDAKTRSHSHDGRHRLCPAIKHQRQRWRSSINRRLVSSTP
jgi:hypothetical protein